MRFWLFKDGESLPMEKGARRMRTGMLAAELCKRGHEVHWFSSTFLHMRKRFHAQHDCRIEVGPGFSLHLLHAGGFKRNISFERYQFYRRYARRVVDHCEVLQPPDRIVCAFPLIDVAYYATEYGLRLGVPVLLDVRDLWPDTIVERFPRFFRPCVRLLLNRDFVRTGLAMQRASHLCAMSTGVLRWALANAGRGWESRDKVIPIGYPDPSSTGTKADSPKVRDILKKLRGRHIFSYVGSFGHTYDLGLLIRVARRLLCENRVPVGFVFAGTGPLHAEVVREAEGLEHVLTPGWLDEGEIRQLLIRSRAGLLPWDSIPDAMPNKFFEYLCAGVPVISSASGELNNLILKTQSGLAYGQKKGDELAGCITRMCQDDEFVKQCSIASKRLFAERFSEASVYGTFANYAESAFV